MSIAKDIIERYDGHMPARNWLGWNKDVKLKDIQLQHIMNEGKDIHEYGFWEPQVTELSYKDQIEDIADRYANPWQLAIDRMAEGTYNVINQEARMSLFGSSSTFYAGNSYNESSYVYDNPLSDSQIIDAYGVY